MNNEIALKFNFPTNPDLDINGVVQSVIEKNMPKKPEVSDLSDTEFGIIDKTKEGVISNLDATSGVLLFSNIIVSTKEELEKLYDKPWISITVCSSIYRNLKFKFHIPDNEKLINKIKLTSTMTFDSSNLVDILAKLDKCTKGIQSVSLVDGDIEKMLSVFDIMDNFKV